MDSCRRAVGGEVGVEFDMVAFGKVVLGQFTSRASEDRVSTSAIGRGLMSLKRIKRMTA